MTLADKVIIAAAAFGVVWLYGVFWQSGGQADAAQILSGKNAPQTISLFRDQTLQIEGSLGRSILEVKDGAIRFVSSPCSSKICIKSGWLRNGGDIAACLPNGISVQVLGGTPYDAINF